MTSVQLGATFAKGLFPVVGAEGATALRVSLGAIMLLAVLRPWRQPTPRSAWPALVCYGLSMGLMNLCFYAALQRIPLALAVALEFTGPLGVSLASSRRWSEVVWVVIAVVGLLSLLPIGAAAAGVDPIGVGLALLAGVFWAAYIVAGQRTHGVSGGQATAIGGVFAAAVVLPIGLVHAGSALFQPSICASAILVALLSSALPYSLEMVALRALPGRVFGTLMSAEPAVAALIGWALLHERLSLRQFLAIGAIMAASLGAALTAQSRGALEPL
jgi:inner membrane transporter RhtA